MKKVSMKRLLKVYKEENEELRQDIKDLLSGDEARITTVKSRYIFRENLINAFLFGEFSYSINNNGDLFNHIFNGKERG